MKGIIGWAIKWSARGLAFGAIFLLLIKCGGAHEPPATLTVEASPTAPGVDLTGYNYAIDPQAYANRDFVDDDEVREIILNDLRSLDGRDRLFARYFTFASLYNSGVPENDLRIMKFGLSKALNHLSYRGEIANPKPVDDKETVFRIDLREYGWRTSTWNFIVARDPYSVFSNDRAEREISRLTNASKAYLRADWFGFAGTQGTLYNAIMDIPRNVRTLEFRFGIDVDRNIRSGRVIRSGFSKSLVSQHNRIVERHEGRFGAYWKSYDFEAPDGRIRRNIFEFPLGGDRFRSNNDFETAGGEMIFALPNGLQVYMLTDGNGNRIDVAPINVVSDSLRYQNREVVNGLACMNCHNAGMKTSVDEIRSHVEANANAFSRQTVQDVLRQYPGNQAVTQAYNLDKDRFTKAMSKVGYGNNTGYPVGEIEPVIHLANWFETELTVERAAAEVGLESDEFVRQIQRSDTLSRRLGPLLQKNGRLRREVFEDNFRRLVQTLRIGDTRRGSFSPYSAVENQTAESDIESSGEPVAVELPDGTASAVLPEEPVTQTADLPDDQVVNGAEGDLMP